MSTSVVSAFAPAAFSVRQQTSLFAEVMKAQTGQSSLDPSVIKKYMDLPFPQDKVLAEYVWVDAAGNTRSKTRTLDAKKAKSVEDLPKWNFDGSSTGQAPGDDSEVILRPCRIFRDPFRPRTDGLDNILVMCDTYTPAGEPLPSNTRAKGNYFLLQLMEESINWTMERGLQINLCISYPFIIPYTFFSIRWAAMEAFAGNEDQEIWFGLEQEFTLFNCK